MLFELLTCPQLADHREVYRAIQEWLGDKVGAPIGRVLIDQEIVCTRDSPVLWTGGRKRPDLQIISNNNCILVQIEVKSGKKETTIRKLTLGLVDQLRWLRNHNTAICKCSGFYFMDHGGRGHVVQVEVEWADDIFKFLQTPHKLPKDGVATKIREVLGEAQRLLDSTVNQPPRCHTLPLSDGFIEAKFGTGAFQVHSG